MIAQLVLVEGGVLASGEESLQASPILGSEEEQWPNWWGWGAKGVGLF